MRSKILFTAAIFAGASLVLAEGGKPKFKIHGGAWLDAGRIVASHDTLTNDGSNNTINLNGSWLQTTGAQFMVEADLSPHLDAAFGFGAYKATHSMGTFASTEGATGETKNKYFAISLFQNFITQARLTYFQGEKETPSLSVSIGTFPFRYNRDTKNLGSYLLRGPVYPGLPMGGFQDFSLDSTKSNILGAHIHHSIGNFGHDLILQNEKELPPTFDWSLAYVANYRALDAIEVGAGVNFYRLIPYNKKLETPGHLALVDGGKSIEVDSATSDTVFFTHQGIKLMGRASIDFNHWFGIDMLGPDDLKLYGEAAVLGIKNYGKTYDKIGERIPVMVGLNLPAFGWLDFLSVEVEYYKSKYRNDIANIGTLNNVADWTIQLPGRPTPSPAPVSGAYADSTKDDLKWSVNIQKTVQNHIQFICQIANDHYRPRPMATGLISSTGGTAETFTTPKDWYYMFRVGYFF